MIRHIVFFKFRDRAGAAATAREAKEKLEGMVGAVEQIRSLEAGVNVVASERAYDLALIVTLDSLDDLEAYGSEPAHESVAVWLRERSSSVVACDYEV